MKKLELFHQEQGVAFLSEEDAISYYKGLVELIEEMVNKTEHEIICWIAEYAYQKANGLDKGTPPSIVYEQVEKDFKKFLSTNPPSGLK